MTEWKDDDEFTTTYGTLKRSLVEAADAERERIVALLRNSVSYCNEQHCCEDCEPVKKLIALIKDESA